MHECASASNRIAGVRILAPHVAEVILAHPKRLRAISHAKVKTDKLSGPLNALFKQSPRLTRLL